MGVLANLLDVEGRLLRKADGLATRGLALLERDAKYRAHRAITRSFLILERGRARIQRRSLDAGAVYGKIARGYHGLSNTDAAWQAAQDSLTFDPRNPDALEIQGLVQLARREAKEAVASFEKALRSCPESAVLWGYRGDAALAAGRKEDAIASFQK